MYIAVVGSGPAGMTAAYRLQQAGHTVEVLEALDLIGGRTHAEHLGPGHHCDTGAGWLTSFYRRTLALFDELGYRDLLVRPRDVRGAADIMVRGQVYHRAADRAEIAATQLLSAEEQARMAAYLAQLTAEQPDDLQVDLAYDDHDAETEFAPLGEGVLNYVYRPMFEGPFFTPLRRMSAAMVRSWLRAYQGVTFYQVAGGMDAPWLRLAEGLNVRTGEPIQTVRSSGAGLELTTRSGARRYDGAVLAVPAPAAAQMLAGEPELAPAWLPEVRYAPEVRVYAARPDANDVAVGVHLAPADPVHSVEWFSGKRGAWGACPPDWQWALVCMSGPKSATLVDLPDDQLIRTIWQDGQSVVPDLFRLEDAAAVHLIRWHWAIPEMTPGHYTRLAAYERRPPVVLAGDWTQQACVEGAVRSGEAAAAAFGTA